MVQVGQQAPGFTLEGALDDRFVEVSLSDYAGSWVVLFSGEACPIDWRPGQATLG